MLQTLCNKIISAEDTVITNLNNHRCIIRAIFIFEIKKPSSADEG